jgi:hypothetical protein
VCAGGDELLRAPGASDVSDAGLTRPTPTERCNQANTRVRRPTSAYARISQQLGLVSVALNKGAAKGASSAFASAIRASPYLGLPSRKSSQGGAPDAAGLRGAGRGMQFEKRLVLNAQEDRQLATSDRFVRSTTKALALTAEEIDGIVNHRDREAGGVCPARVLVTAPSTLAEEHKKQGMAAVRDERTEEEAGQQDKQGVARQEDADLLGQEAGSTQACAGEDDERGAGKVSLGRGGGGVRLDPVLEDQEDLQPTRGSGWRIAKSRLALITKSNPYLTNSQLPSHQLTATPLRRGSGDSSASPSFTASHLRRFAPHAEGRQWYCQRWPFIRKSADVEEVNAHNAYHNSLVATNVNINPVLARLFQQAASSELDLEGQGSSSAKANTMDINEFTSFLSNLYLSSDTSASLDEFGRKIFRGVAAAHEGR